MHLKFNESAVLAAGVEQSFFERVIDYMSYLCSIEISNDGDTNPTTSFKVQLQDHPEGEFYTVLSGSDFATASSFLRRFSTNTPAALVHNTKAHLCLDLNGVYAFRLVATSTSGTILSVRGGMSVID